LCTTVVYNTTQNSFDNLPSYLQTNSIAQMLSIRGEGSTAHKRLCYNALYKFTIDIEIDISRLAGSLCSGLGRGLAKMSCWRHWR